MRKLDTNDFETANIEYIEFWMLDPLSIPVSRRMHRRIGDLYFNLGEVSEDVLHDGRNSTSGMPVDGTSGFTTTQWGKIPNQPLRHTPLPPHRFEGETRCQFQRTDWHREQTYSAYQTYLASINGKSKLSRIRFHPWPLFWQMMTIIISAVRISMKPKTSILNRYKADKQSTRELTDTDNNTESYDTSYKAGPDVEDINQDYTLNEYEKYYQYHLPISPWCQWMGGGQKLHSR